MPLVPFPILRVLALALASTLLATATVLAQARTRPYDGYEQLLHDEASEAMARGDYLRAEHLFWRLTRIDPDDAHALREAGRAAFALGDLEYAARALGRVEVLQAGALDPEVPYLRGQALIALGRREEGELELAEAERQLSPVPPERQSTLWLARIYALRGEVARSEALYRTQLGSDRETAAHAEVMLYIVEAHILGADWRGAERLLRGFLADQPAHERGRRLLAWVLEGRGKIGEELSIREALAREWNDHPDHVLGHAHALERAGDDAAALAMYRRAARLGATDRPGLERTALRQSPELAAGMTFGDDLSGSMIGWTAGATLPFGSGLRLALSGSGATARPVAPAGSTSMPERTMSTSVTAQLLLNHRGWMLAAGPTVRFPGVSESIGLGGSAALRTAAGRPLELQLLARVGQPWRESTATVSEGGVIDTVGAEAFARIFSGRVILGLTAHGRRLGLEAMADAQALQLFASAGVDVVLWSAPRRVARGQILDDDMMWPATLTTGLVLSFRHNELHSEHPFGARLVLVPQSRIEELSASFRYVVDDVGAVAVELHGGIGPDLARDVLTSRAGGTLLIAATAGSRLTAAYDFASQIGTGLSGLRHTGGVTFHVDL